MHIPMTDAISLLHAAPHAVLATNSTQMPGFPYATAVPLVVDAAQRPLLLISALAEHTKNLLADPRASLAVINPGESNVQNTARMTLVGRFERVKADANMVARYLRYQPEAKQYMQLDFMFFRLNIERSRFIGGVGRMGWLEGAAWDDMPALPPEIETRLLAKAGNLPADVQLLGLDCHGIDFTLAGQRRRHAFAQAMTDAALEKHLPEALGALG